MTAASFLRPAWKQGTSWHLASLPSVSLVLHSFRNIGEPLGVWPSSIVCFLYYLFQESTVTQGGLSKALLCKPRYMALINKHSACIVRGWLMHEARSWPGPDEHLTTQQSSCCSPHTFHLCTCFFWIIILLSAVCSDFPFVRCEYFGKRRLVRSNWFLRWLCLAQVLSYDFYHALLGDR